MGLEYVRHRGKDLQSILLPRVYASFSWAGLHLLFSGEASHTTPVTESNEE